MIGKRVNSFAIATLGAILLSVAFAGMARAEQCQQASTWPEKSITVCLLTDQPVVVPATLQFRVPAEVTRFSGGTIVQQGPGDTNVWEIKLVSNLVDSDGVYPFRALASVPWSGPCDSHTGQGCGSDDYETTFPINVQTPIANTHTTVRSTKQKVTVTYSYEARTTVMPVVQLYLNAFPKRKTIIVTRRGGARPVTGPGTHTLSVSIPRKAIKRLCKDYGGCFVLGWGRSWISAPGLPERAQEADHGTYSPRKKVYTRPKPRRSQKRTPRTHLRGVSGPVFIQEVK